MLHDRLWKLNADLTERCVQHPFVRGLADGSLDREAFRRYVAQDAFFLRAFLQGYALAAAKSDDLQQIVTLHELMGGVLEELELHASYARSLQIDLDRVQPYEATTAYTSFLLRVAWQGELAEIFAAMVPYMRLYAHLGNELSLSLRSEHPYEEWIKTYSSDEFGKLCDRLESLLNTIATETEEVTAAYRYAMQCELDFFSAPLENKT